MRINILPNLYKNCLLSYEINVDHGKRKIFFFTKNRKDPLEKETRQARGKKSNTKMEDKEELAQIKRQN